jgi:NTP pyrophosphatase (non-canonical NTP hydrolase)
MDDKNPNLDGITWANTIKHLLYFAKKYETMPTWALTMKLTEETGELNEILLRDYGYLQHKNKEWESPIDEAADIINVLIGVLASHYPDLNAEQLSNALLEAIDRKGKKWLNIITQPNPTTK